MIPIFLRTLTLALLLTVVAAAPASANRDQFMTFEAPKDLLNPATRETALKELDSLGVRGLRLVMRWHDVAPGADDASKPDFDTTDPGNYAFADYDAVLDAAKARKWKVLLTLSGPVPVWATKDRKDTTTRPDTSEFAQFVEAAGKRFADRVTLWSIWNEPNQPQFLQPQYDSKGNPASPRIYRALYKAALKGFTAAKIPKPTVLFGETSPVGTGKVVAPLTFLRGALCLSSAYKLQKGCGTLPTAGYAHHAYTRKQGPTYKPPGPNNVTVGVLSRLTKALDRAGKANAIPDRLPLYLTEFGIQSRPDTLAGVSYQQQAEFRATSERIAYDNSRVRSFSQYLLRDDNPIPNVSALERFGGFESGLRTAGGKPKPSLDAFRLPLSVRRAGSRAQIWGLVRPATAPTKAVLQYRNGASGPFRALRTITTNRLGYFQTTAGYRSGRQYRLTWTSGEGKAYQGTPIRAYRR